MNAPNVESCFVAGASRGVGFEIVKGLCQGGYAVTALIRTADTQAQLAALGAHVVIADALDLTAISSLLQAFRDGPFTLVTTIGGKGSTRDEPRSDYLGNRNLVDAVGGLPCQRFLLVSSIGVRESAIALPPPVLETLRPALLAKAKAEEHLIASGLPYTIIRPGGLTNDPPTGNALLTEDTHAAGSISRADVATLAIQCLQSQRAAGRTLAAVDRDALRCEQPVNPFTV